MAGTVSVNFSLDRDIYNQYKRIVSNHGENVKGNLVRHMQTVIRYGIPNSETLEAIAEVQALKRDPNKKSYGSFSEILEDMDE
ncbi:hypothetical protein HMPREF1986_00954 [Oribacterium sp. oral taxon 078 str. F0263]|uniref:hypothetical protein n=1 Tax=Oribacterium sp. oral taxon 078 TaxID=652706 RepID=UPI0003ADA418|nr:hypothetical protein [Oribacterium sp. oral taxon 078]ERL21923.1 hypothetical protein HMPREF1986_00954 [Oribacterium sp. oral taxon 078 str. F0263]